MELMQHQLDAISQLKNGCVLYGGVGSGKTLAALAYYMKAEQPRNIIVITTARKRNSLDWEKEAAQVGILDITIDSWNNIGKYTDVKDAMFFFDEQRLVSNGVWVKAFIKIARGNHWIMLSATPGDVWLDYAPLFIANGFYKNITQFKLEHVLYYPWSKYPKIKGYLNERKLELFRNEVLVEMPYFKHTQRYLNYTEVEYDKALFKRVVKDRWNIYEDRPIKDVSELFRLMRKVVNSDSSRLEAIRDLMIRHPRIIVFYTNNFELDILRTLSDDIDVFEYNGHVKDEVPTGDNWVYLVQYVAGAEAWNCISTDTVVMYSLTYSYKNFEQAQGRIDRLNTPYTDLRYYILVSDSTIDRAIKDALQNKKNFNEKKFIETEAVYG